jgi:hypothetical protein
MSENKLPTCVFPLEQWFDLAKPIRRSDADLCEAQMALYELKNGDDPESPEARAIYQQMRLAVWQHNKRLRKA